MLQEYAENTILNTRTKLLLIHLYSGHQLTMRI